MKLIDRLQKEYKKLNNKRGKLDDFLFSEDYDKLSETHQNLLDSQFSAMTTYLYILKTRIDKLRKESNNCK